MDYNGMMALAGQYAESGYFPQIKKPAQAFVLIMAGEELGFSSVMAMRGIKYISGQLTMGAGLVAAAIRKSKRYDYRIAKHTDSECVIEIVNKETGEVLPAISFTMDDARKAGLAGGENWKKYGPDMLFARAITRAARRHCPDLFGGAVYVPEELGEQGKPDAAPQDDAPEPQKDVKTEIGEHFAATQPETPPAQVEHEKAQEPEAPPAEEPPAPPAPPAEEANPQDAPSHLVRLEALCAKYKLGEKQKKAWCAFFQVERIEDLNAEQIDKIITGAEKRFGAKA